MSYSTESEKPPEGWPCPFTQEAQVNPRPPAQSPHLVSCGGSAFPVRRRSGETASPLCGASCPTQEAQSMECSRTSWCPGSPGRASLTGLFYLRPSAVLLSWALGSCEHPRSRIPTTNVAAKYCKTPNSPICVLPPKRENSLHRHSLIWQANSKPYWQSQSCFPNQTAMEPKIALPVIC